MASLHRGNRRLTVSGQSRPAAIPVTLRMRDCSPIRQFREHPGCQLDDLEHAVIISGAIFLPRAKRRLYAIDQMLGCRRTHFHQQSLSFADMVDASSSGTGA